MNKRILVVDDIPANIDILLALLGDTYDILAAVDGETALEIANEEQLDLILLDVMMPDMDGYSVCEALKKDVKTKEIPVIFITAVTDEVSIERAYEVGGIDYVTKPFKPKELRARIKRELQMQSLIYDLAQSQRELERLATTDALSDLYNRYYFSKISDELFMLAKRNKRPMSIIILDIDNFKKINDVHGHGVGDEVIKHIAKTLKDVARKSDVICRWGGEEFLLLLPETDGEGAYIMAENIRKMIEQSEVSINRELTIQYRASFGVSVVDNSDEKGVDKAIHNADEALYEAKALGRNRVCIAKTEENL